MALSLHRTSTEPRAPRRGHTVLSFCRTLHSQEELLVFPTGPDWGPSPWGAMALPPPAVLPGPHAPVPGEQGAPDADQGRAARRQSWCARRRRMSRNNSERLNSQKPCSEGVCSKILAPLCHPQNCIFILPVCCGGREHGEAADEHVGWHHSSTQAAGARAGRGALLPGGTPPGPWPQTGSSSPAGCPAQGTEPELRRCC